MFTSVLFILTKPGDNQQVQQDRNASTMTYSYTEY